MSLVNELVLQASAAKTASYQGSSVATAQINRPFGANTGLQLGAYITLDCTTSSGTNPTLQVGIQGQDASNGSWITIPGLVFGTITNSAAHGVVWPYPLPPNLRVAATIGGTTPSFTFAVKAQALG